MSSVLSWREEKHRELCRTHKRVLIALDILLILTILMNFGAAYLTSNMVVKKAVVEGVQLEFREVNPVMATVGKWQLHPEAIKMYSAIIFLAGLWILLLGFYIYYRINFYKTKHVFWMTLMVLFYFSIMGYDFFHDLGMWVMV